MEPREINVMPKPYLTWNNAFKMIVIPENIPNWDTEPAAYRRYRYHQNKIKAERENDG